MMDLFSSTFGTFILMCDTLPNLDENDTLFLNREQNEQYSSKVGWCGHRFLEGYFEVYDSSKIGLYWSSIFGMILFYYNITKIGLYWLSIFGRLLFSIISIQN